MAKFSSSFSDSHGFLSGENAGDMFSSDELLEVLRPAGLRLKEFYQQTIRRLFKQRTGSLAESIDIEDDYVEKKYSAITVKPFGAHKTGSYTRSSRAGSSTAKYAKHGRKPSKKKVKNEEVAYLLEHGTPRITATHWMENANDEISEEIQDMIESEFTALLRKKGLIE